MLAGERAQEKWQREKQGMGLLLLARPGTLLAARPLPHTAGWGGQVLKGTVCEILDSGLW